MPRSVRTTRRSFLKATAATGAAMSLPLWWRKSYGQESANDRLTIGSIGRSLALPA